jgi:RHS repeat-associated protein
MIFFRRVHNGKGMIIRTSGLTASCNAYTGDYNELVYLRARYYAPSSGRFMTKDTWLGDQNKPLSLNRWNYTQSNPINFTDPSGYLSTYSIAL